MAGNPASSQDAWTIGRLLTWTAQHFTARQVDEPRLAAELLLAKAMGCARIHLYARFNDAPSEQSRSAFREMVRRAAEHEPIAYLVGHKEFYSLDFCVTPDVLIPRPETELLVERALVRCNELSGDRIDLLDVGTGSGCIAITLAKRCSKVQAAATDISASALDVARRNAERHGVTDRIRFCEADLLDLPAEAVPDGGFDLVISNPPYIAETERDSPPKNVRDYEPAAALFAGPDGLEAYRRIAAGITDLMRPGGMLVVEVAFDRAAAVQEVFASAAGALGSPRRYKDLGGIDRALEFRLSP